MDDAHDGPSRASGDCDGRQEVPANGEGSDGNLGVLTCSTADAQAFTDSGAGDGSEKSRAVTEEREKTNDGWLDMGGATEDEGWRGARAPPPLPPLRSSVNRVC